MSKRINIGNVELEKDLSPFNGHLPFERRDMSEELEEAEFELEHLLLGGSGVQIVFVEQNGTVYFGFGSYGYEGLLRYGKIPAEVQAQGEEAIRAHAMARMSAALEKYDAWNARCERYQRNPDVVIEIQHEEVRLLARITRADHRYFRMQIEEPFQAEVKGGGYNQWSAMRGDFMFDHSDYVESDPNEMCLSSHTIEIAKRELVERHKAHQYAEQNKETVGLVSRLNGKVEP